MFTFVNFMYHKFYDYKLRELTKVKRSSMYLINDDQCILIKRNVIL